jgi:hypothetical protein
MVGDGSIMTFGINEKIELWEAIAAVCLLQQTQAIIPAIECESWVAEVMQSAGMWPREFFEDKDRKMLNFSGAYRAVDNSKLSYIDILAAENGLRFPRPSVLGPRFQSHGGAVMRGKPGSIVLAPCGLKGDLDIPVQVWQSVARFLRSYGRNVLYMGLPGQRLDRGAFFESEIITSRSWGEKLAVIEEADLIVGVPNAWTWAATGWNKNIVVLYPDHIPPLRWFWFDSPKFSKIIYIVHQIQTPVILSGIRQMIEKM